MEGEHRTNTDHRRSEPAGGSPDTDLLAALLTASPEAAAVLGPEGTVQACNAAFARFLGYAPHEAGATSLVDALSAGDVSRLRVGLAFLDGGHTAASCLSFALRLSADQGEARDAWFDARPFGQVWLAHLYRDHPALLQALARHGGDGAALIGADGRIQAMTQASGRFLAVDPLAVIDQSFLSLASPEDHPGLSSLLNAALDPDQSSGPGEGLVFDRPGDPSDKRPEQNVCVAVHFVPLTDEAPDTQGAIAIFRDMAGLKHLEQERDTALRAAEEAGQTKSRFLAGMSHELRTPLNAVIGFSDILSQELFGPLGNERYKEYIGLIRQSGVTLLQLITDILDLARIDAGRYSLRLEKIDAEGLISKEVETWKDRAALKEITLDVALPPDRLSFMADRLALSQILTNLLSNAVKFTEAGGRITVAIEERGGEISLVVMDTGVGIAPEILPKLGRAFEQVVAESSENGGSNGIGMALVNALAGLHNGSVSIESTVGEGTTITVRMPKDVVAPPAEDGERSETGSRSAA